MNNRTTDLLTGFGIMSAILLFCFIGYSIGYRNGSTDVAEMFFDVVGNVQIESLNIDINETAIIDAAFDKMGINSSAFNMSKLNNGEIK